MRISRLLSIGLHALVLVMCACGGSIAIGAGGVGVGAGASTSDDGYKKSIEDWHQTRVKRLTAEDGWVTLVGLFQLENGTHTFGSADDNEFVFPKGSPAHAGTLVVADTLVTLTPAPGVEMTLDKKPVGETVLALDSQKDGPSIIQMGPIRFYVIDRPGSLYLRVKDANSAARRNFTDIDRFPVDRHWCFNATFEPYKPPRPVRVVNALGYEEMVLCPGMLTFQKDGKTYHLEPMAQEGDQYYVVFGDASSGNDTYGGGREVYVDVPGPDGKTVVDFNKAYNPPCVFTVFATCPLPRPANILPFRVEAGEKMWGSPHHP